MTEAEQSIYTSERGKIKTSSSQCEAEQFSEAFYLQHDDGNSNRAVIIAHLLKTAWTIPAKGVNYQCKLFGFMFYIFVNKFHKKTQTDKQ